jgi:hypothetical protein
MKIIIEGSSLVKGSSNITGKIYIDFKEFAFPGKGWNDFVVKIISWWLEGLERILNRSSKSEIFRFMDGPYYFKVTDGLEKYEIHFYHSDKLIKHTTVSKEEFRDSIFEAGQTVSVLCSEHSWNMKEVIEIRNSLGRLE